MALFDDRENAYEKKFAYDEETRFKINARCNKLLALWAAQQMGYDENKALKYAMDVVEAGLTLTGDWDIVYKILADIERSDINIAEPEIREHHEKLYQIATTQITGDK